MKLEDQVSSLELAKRLKELGVKKKSLWVWEFADDVPSNLNAAASSGSNMYAYSVAELGEILPFRSKQMPFIGFNNDALLHEIISYGNGKKAYAMYFEGDVTSEKLPSPLLWDEKEADARAKMLIYLLENKLISNPQ